MKSFSGTFHKTTPPGSQPRKREVAGVPMLPRSFPIFFRCQEREEQLHEFTQALRPADGISLSQEEG